MSAYQASPETPAVSVPGETAEAGKTPETKTALETGTVPETGTALETGTAPETGTASESRGAGGDRIFQLLSALCVQNPFSGRVLCYRADQDALDGIDRWITAASASPVLIGSYSDTDSLLAGALQGTLTLLYLHEIPAGLTDRMWHRLVDAVEQTGYFILQLSTLELPTLPPWLLAGSMMIHTEQTPDDDTGMWLFRIRMERR